jgi:hypothetical protein
MPDTGPLKVRVNIPYGDSQLKLELPHRWLGEIVQPSIVPPMGELDDLIHTALHNPIGSPRVEQIVVPELMGKVKILAGRYFNPIEIYRTVALIYIILVAAATWIVRAVEIRMQTQGLELEVERH